MAVSRPSQEQTQIPVLVADDSIVFRRYLRDILADSEHITIGGEAKNGIETLDLVLKVRPKVILMDMEMPLMDGMTALQHLMIHCPTPTIMFSSLTREGTFRAFDAMKNGAVDFFSKDLLFDEKRQEAFRHLLADKIQCASQLSVNAIEPVFDQMKGAEEESAPVEESRVIFCEECGARNHVEGGTTQAYCSACGDVLVEYHQVEIFRRNSHVTVLGGGEDCLRNLLNFIPRLHVDPSSSTIAVIKADNTYVDSFSEYLDAISPMKILRVRDGMSLESGYCYIASATDQIALQQHATQQTLVKIDHPDRGIGPVDLVMTSVASAFRKKCTGILLSNGDMDGVRGLAEIRSNGAKAVVLKPESCLSPKAVNLAIEKIDGVMVVEDDEKLTKVVHDSIEEAKGGGVTLL